MELDAKVETLKGFYEERTKNSEFIIGETCLKVDSELIWSWVAIETKSREIRALSISKERNMFISERFLSGLGKIHRKHYVSTDG